MTDSNIFQPVQVRTPTPASARRVGLSRAATTAPLLRIIKGRTSNPQTSISTPISTTTSTTAATATSVLTADKMPRFVPGANPKPTRILVTKQKGGGTPKRRESEEDEGEDLLAPPKDDTSSSEDERRSQSIGITPTVFGGKKAAPAKTVKEKKIAAPPVRTNGRPARKTSVPSSSALSETQCQEVASSISSNTNIFGDYIPKKKTKSAYGAASQRKSYSSQSLKPKWAQNDEGSPEPATLKTLEEIASTPRRKRKRPGADLESGPELKLQSLDTSGLDTPVTKRATKPRNLGDVIDESDAEDEFKSSLELKSLPNDFLSSPVPVSGKRKTLVKPGMVEDSDMDDDVKSSLVLSSLPDDFLKSPEPVRSPKRRDPNLDKYHTSTQIAPKFNLDMLDSDLLLTQAQDILDQDGFTSSKSEARDDHEEPFAYPQTQLPSTCPMCHAPVDPLELKAKGTMNVAAQERYCQSHQRKTAQDDWNTLGYPEINWNTLPKRLEQYHKNVERWINGEDSHYRGLYASRLAAGQDRTLRKLTSNLIPGYYGSRGLQVISEFIMHNHTRLLKKVAPRDALISKRSVAAYMQAVLVPEITTLLIMDDMSVDAVKARGILEDSVVMGELLQEEVKDVHVKKRKRRVEDSEEDSDDYDELA